MISILEIIDTYNIGGPGKTIINTALYIDRNTYKTYVCSFINCTQTEFSGELVKNNIPHFSLWDGYGIQYENIKLLCRIIRECDINIVHTHGFKSDFYGFIIKIIFPNIKLITTQHGYINNDLKGVFNNTITNIILNFFNKIIFVSYDTLNKSITNKIIHNKAEVVYNAIIYEDYQRGSDVDKIKNKFSIEENDFIVGFVGRLSKEKGVLELIDIIKRIKKYEPSIKLLIIGDGYLENIIRDKSITEILNKDILLTGHVHPIKPYFEIVDILISPSKTEGLSNTILEGLSLEIPVIATNVGGNREIINNFHNGFLINKLDEEIIIDIIKKIRVDDKFKEKITQNGVRTIKEKFNFTTRTKKIEQIYNKLLMNQGQ